MNVMYDVAELRRWLADTRPPATSMNDLGSALQSLRRDSSELVAEFVACTGYSRSDAMSLWQDQEHFLLNAQRIVGTVKPVRGTRSRQQFLAARPLGKVLVCLPSNAPVPLAAALTVSSLLAGNLTVFTRPRQISNVVDRIIACFSDVSGIGVYTRSPRDLVPDVLDAFDHVYFMGSSAAYPQLAFDCAQAGVGLTFEGQGNGFAYISESAAGSLPVVVDMLLAAKAFCNGRMCSAPNTVLVHTALKDRFLDAWNSQCRNHQTAALGTLLHEESTTWLASRSTYSDIESRTHPIAVVANELADIPMFEFFSPVIAVASVNSFEEALASIGRSKFRLQASYFGQSTSEWAQFKTLNFCRIVANMNPADQDPVAPWGNFGMSGWSPAAIFEDKLLQWQLVEGGDSL